MRKSFGIFLMTACASQAWAVVDKSSYDLFHPTPANLVREFDSDRPGVTDSPHTVDAGHFQIETGLVDFTRHDFDNSNWTFNSLFLRVGMRDNIELQMALDSLVNQSSRTNNLAQNKIGIGNSTFRLKQNLIGNEQGLFAIGLIPYLVLPTQEGGLNLPIALHLPNEYSFELMPALAYKKNTDNGYHYEFSNGFILSKTVARGIDGFIQFLSTSSSEPGAAWAAGSGLGLTLKISSNMQWDLGALWGLTPAQDNVQASLGLAWRFE